MEMKMDRLHLYKLSQGPPLLGNTQCVHNESTLSSH